MNPITRLSEFTEDWKFFTVRDGIKPSLPLIVSEIGELPYRHLRFVVLARSLLDPFPDWQPKIPLLIRHIERMDLDLIRQMNRPSEARLCEHRLTEGHKGLVAFHDGRLAGYAWGSSDIHTRLERVHPKLSVGDVLFTDSYTSPVFRGQGIQTGLTLARFKLFRDLGYSRAVSYIEVRNGPSLAVWQRKYYSQTIGTIDFKRFGPWYRVRIRLEKNGY